MIKVSKYYVPRIHINSPFSPSPVSVSLVKGSRRISLQFMAHKRLCLYYVTIDQLSMNLGKDVKVAFK